MSWIGGFSFMLPARYSNRVVNMLYISIKFKCPHTFAKLFSIIYLYKNLFCMDLNFSFQISFKGTHDLNMHNT